MTETATDIGLSAMTMADTRRRVAIIISLVLILAAAGAALFMVRGVDTQVADIVRSNEVRKSAQEVILAVTEAETGQRGYLLTLDGAYLEPYERAIASIDGNYNQLIDQLASEPERRAAIEGLRDQIERKRAEMAATIQLASTGRASEALAIIRSDAGKSLMDDIASELRTFIAQEDATLADRNLEVERYRQWLVAAILAALAGAATLAYALFNRTQKQVSDLARTRSVLQQQNEELEEHVRRRTAEAEEARAHAERERERVEALLQDTNHRIGNSLATVSSLLGLQLQRSRSEEVKRALEAAQSRVQAIASGHRRLRLGADLETTKAHEFLGAVIEDLRVGQAVDTKVELITEFEPLEINARDATTIGIVLGELVTNALKHAFPDGRQGSIRALLARDADGVITLTVEDDGKGYDGHAGEGGLGSMIIRQLAMQFGGEPRYENREAGGARVVLPLPGLERRPAD
jgi:two-component sensor histidine kinase